MDPQQSNKIDWLYSLPLSESDIKSFADKRTGFESTPIEIELFSMFASPDIGSSN